MDLIDIDYILNEWSFRCHDGIVDINNPAKKDILIEILKEHNIEGLDEEIKNQYDDVIYREFNKKIPKVVGNYTLGKNVKVNSKDLNNFKKLYDVSPPKVGKDVDTAGSKGSGNGEISVYWLFKYQSHPANVTDTRGKGAPDLNINGKGVEIKAYDSPRMTLGRVGSDHENVSLLNTVFGLHSLVTNINRNEKIEKQHSSLNFTKKGIIEAFNSFIDFNNNEELRELSSKYSLIKGIYDKVDEILNIIGKIESPEEGASILIKRLLKRKTSEKPGFGGYILNVSENGELKWTKVTEDIIDKIPSENILDNVFLNQGMLVMNSDKLFN